MTFERQLRAVLDSLSLLLVMTLQLSNNIIVHTDFKSIELRLVAHFSQDHLLLSILNSNTTPDVFVHLASEWYNVYVCKHWKKWILSISTPCGGI